MSESFAKMHLRDHVRDDDVDNAIKVISFLTQHDTFPRK